MDIMQTIPNRMKWFGYAKNTTWSYTESMRNIAPHARSPWGTTAHGREGQPSGGFPAHPDDLSAAQK